MSKKQNLSPPASQKQPSVGVGQYYADPEREIIEWTAVYFQGKFYLSDPYSIAKLQEIQSQIDLQKKIAVEFREIDQIRAESERSFHNNNNVNTSRYSCATQKSPQKMRLKQIKAEKELYREEEAYMNKLIELKNRRKQLENQKASKNMIAVKKEDIKSVKEVKVKKESVKGESICREVPQIQQKVQIQAESMHMQTEKVQPPKQSVVAVKLDELQEKAFKAIILQTKSMKKSLKHESIKHMEESIAKPKQLLILKQSEHIASNESPRSKQESIIIGNLKLVSPPASPLRAINILDISSQAENEINQQLANQRAGNSFFNEIQSQLYKLQHNINNISPQQVEKQEKKSQIKEEQQQERYRADRKHGNYRPSHLLEQTQNILKELHEGLEQLDQQELLQNPTILNKTHISNKSIHNQEDNHPPEKLQQQQQKLSPLIELSPIKAAITQTKHKKLLFASSIVNYQIKQSPQQSSEIQSEQKQKLQKEINVLQQVINQLRIQRLKYQVSQHSRVEEQQHADRTNYSSTDKQNGTRNLLRLAQTPPLTNVQDISHFNATTPSPMVESSVSEYHNASSMSKYKIARSKSGKIVRNVFSESQMPKIEEQLIGQMHNEQKIEQKQLVLREESEKEGFMQNASKHIDAATSYQIEDANTLQNQQQNVTTSGKPKTDKAKVQQKTKKQQVKQHSFKIKNISQYPKHSSTATQHINTSKQQAVSHQRNQTDLESSMPRTLINRHNHSNPPKITPQQHQDNIRKRQKSVNKELLDQFAQLNQNKYSTVQPQVLDPKRRASREGILKNIDPKIPQAGNTIDTTSNIKRKIFEMEHSKKPTEQSVRDQSKSRNFRTRRESESIRNSRASLTNKSSKSVDNSRQKRPDNNVYVPALNPSINHPLSPKEDTIYQARFDQGAKNLDISKQDVKKRKVVFSNIKMPVFPQAPSPNVTAESMLTLIQQLGKALNMQFKDRDLDRMVMKKFKNCIMLDMPGDSNRKLVWHYNQKIYLGGWDESAMQKQGEGLEYIPARYFYRGEFVNNKRQGNGIMLFFNDSIYEGQWFEGQKDGKGKYQDKSLGLYYEGEWKEGKRNGIGYLQVQGQSIYQGSFSSNYRTGYGSQKFSNEDLYKGEYQMGKFHGQGIYLWASGSSYEGEFCQGLKHGQGKWRSGSGDLYIGQFFQDKKQGAGRFIWQNGCIYQGEFALDKKHGKGTLKYSDGRKVLGLWKNGQLIQTAAIEEQEGRQQPLAYRKGQKFETVTIIKSGEQKSKRFSVSGRVSNC